MCSSSAEALWLDIGSSLWALKELLRWRGRRNVSEESWIET